MEEGTREMTSTVTIHQLDNRTIQRIAAGEVVERPASVVKELVENSLDAGSSRISVDIFGDTGTERIVVDDDGHGIPPDQLPLAVQPHTTSKITAHDDLDHGPGTLGFRGEALHAISQVATLSIATHHPEASAGRELVIDGGEVIDDTTLGLPIGTRVTVERLFEHVPARKKFLDAPATERGHIRRAVAHLALANPSVAIRLAFDENEVFATPGDGDLKAAVAAVHSRPVAEGMLRLVAPNDLPEGVHDISGLISEPDTHRSTVASMTTMVNGRPVESSALRQPIVAGYGNRLSPNRYPLVVVNVEMEPRLVDVNVHPRKHEIHLDDAAALQDAIRAVVTSTLDTKASPPTGPARDTDRPRQGGRGPRPAINIGAVSQDGKQATLPGSPPDDSPDRFERLPTLAIIGQIHETYIVAETSEGGVLLVDQHAADERINYERLRDEVRAATGHQRLATPVRVELTNEEADALSTYREHVENIGFRVEAVEGNTVQVTAVPSILGQALTADDLTEVLHQLLTGMVDADGTESLLELVDPLLADLACHPAIKANQSLSAGSMRSLLNVLDTCNSPWTCPHGRPTMVELTDGELAERFERDYPGSRGCRDWGDL